MKKNIKLMILTTFMIFPLNVHAIDFKLDKDAIFENNSTNNISETLNGEYAIKSEKNNANEEYEELTKKVTYLLLGIGDEEGESSREFYSRKKEYIEMMYNPDVSGLSMNDPLFIDASVAGITVPTMFNIMDDLDIKYDYFGNIKISKTSDEEFISRIDIPNITMKSPDNNNPKKYVEEKTNLSMFYIFKKYKNEYKLYYLKGETTDDMMDYIKQSESKENSGVFKLESSDMSSSNIYNFTKLKSLTNKQINNVYNANVSKFMMLNTQNIHGDNYSASGFMLTNDILVTSWTYLKKCLIDGSDIVISDYKKNIYDLEGIVSININNDLVLLKIKGYSSGGIVIGDSDSVSIEDPVISIGTKSGYGVSSTSSIIISNDDEIQTLIPITDSDVGGPLFNKEGKLIGIINNKSILSSDSYATKVTNLKELQDKLSSDNNIKYSSYKELKDNYYYLANNEENIVKSIPDKIWKKVSKVGNIDKIELPLVKAAYKNNVVSLRYNNNAISVLDNSLYMNIIKGSLKDNNYKEVLNSKNKIIYENKDYKVVAMNEFNYLIVLMVIK